MFIVKSNINQLLGDGYFEQMTHDIFSPVNDKYDVFFLKSQNHFFIKNYTIKNFEWAFCSLRFIDLKCSTDGRKKKNKNCMNIILLKYWLPLLGSYIICNLICRKKMHTSNTYWLTSKNDPILLIIKLLIVLIIKNTE